MILIGWNILFQFFNFQTSLILTRQVFLHQINIHKITLVKFHENSLVCTFLLWTTRFWFGCFSSLMVTSMHIFITFQTRKKTFGQHFWSTEANQHPSLVTCICKQKKSHQKFESMLFSGNFSPKKIIVSSKLYFYEVTLNISLLGSYPFYYIKHHVSR